MLIHSSYQCANRHNHRSGCHGFKTLLRPDMKTNLENIRMTMTTTNAKGDIGGDLNG